MLPKCLQNGPPEAKNEFPGVTEREKRPRREEEKKRRNRRREEEKKRRREEEKRRRGEEEKEENKNSSRIHHCWGPSLVQVGLKRAQVDPYDGHSRAQLGAPKAA